MKPRELKGFREKIDSVDDQIIKLLAERAGYVKEVGRRKRPERRTKSHHPRLVLTFGGPRRRR